MVVLKTKRPSNGFDTSAYSKTALVQALQKCIVMLWYLNVYYGTDGISRVLMIYLKEYDIPKIALFVFLVCRNEWMNHLYSALKIN